MERYQKIVVVLGIILIIIFLPIDIFFAGIAAIITVALFVSFLMVNLSKRFAIEPELIAVLAMDAKAVVIKNKGEAQAVNIHVAVVPLDIEFDVPQLEPDAQYQFALPHMVEEAKAAITYEDAQGRHFAHSSPLSAMEGGEEDLLKPMFPMFGWK